MTPPPAQPQPRYSSIIIGSAAILVLVACGLYMGAKSTSKPVTSATPTPTTTMTPETSTTATPTSTPSPTPTSTPTSTPNASLITNKTYGYSFTLPSDTAIGTSSTDTATVVASGDANGHWIYQINAQRISGTANLRQLLSDDILNANGGTNKDYAATATYKDVTIGNYSAVEAFLPFGDSGNMEIAIAKGNLALIIDSTGGSASDNSATETFISGISFGTN